MNIDSVVIPDVELIFSFARSGGPGGQNVNKVSSKAVLHWNIAANATIPVELKKRMEMRLANRITTDGFLVIQSQKYRDQPKNIDDCREKLGAFVRAAMHVPKARKPTKPSKGANARRLSAKKRQSKRKAGRGQPVREE
jgi:ribosome-associated protein